MIDGRCTCGNPACSSPGKHPDVSGRKKDGAGYGVQTGNGLVVVDIDRKKEGADGLLSLAGKELPDTYTVMTPSGGLHLYYSYDPTQQMGNRVGVFPGVDIRGDGGFVVGVGSPHANGGTYCLLGDEVPIVPAPDWVLEAAHKIATEDCPVVALQRTEEELEAVLGACVRDLLATPPSVAGDQGHNAAFLAAQIPTRRYQLERDKSIELFMTVFNPRCEPPWSLREAEHKVDEAIRRGNMCIGDPSWLARVVTGPIVVGKLTTPGNRKKHDPSHEYSCRVGDPAFPQRSPLDPGDIASQLKMHEKWAGVWQYDEFADKIMAVDPPIRLDAEKKGLTEVDGFRIACWFSCNGYKVSDSVAFKAAVAVAEENRFHPVREYLQELPAAGTSHLATLAKRLFGDASKLAQTMVKMTLVSAVRRIQQPGCKVDTSLILYGNQGPGKSSTIQALFGSQWYNPQCPDLSDGKRAGDVAGYWVLELGELSQMLKVGNSAAKDFLSRQRDVYIPMHGRKKVDIPRQCIFIGSTNDDDFLTDATGNRRYLPVCIPDGFRCDINWIFAHRDEIWAEAVACTTNDVWSDTGHLVATDFKHWFEDEREVQPAREDVTRTDPWIDRVTQYCAGREFVQSTDIYLSCIDTDPHATSRMDHGKQNRIIGILKQIGCKRQNKKIDGRCVKVWLVPEPLASTKPVGPEAVVREMAKLAQN